MALACSPRPGPSSRSHPPCVPSQDILGRAPAANRRRGACLLRSSIGDRRRPRCRSGPAFAVPAPMAADLHSRMSGPGCIVNGSVVDAADPSGPHPAGDVSTDRRAARFRTSEAWPPAPHPRTGRAAFRWLRGGSVRVGRAVPSRRSRRPAARSNSGGACSAPACGFASSMAGRGSRVGGWLPRQGSTAVRPAWSATPTGRSASHPRPRRPPPRAGSRTPRSGRQHRSAAALGAAGLRAIRRVARRGRRRRHATPPAYRGTARCADCRPGRGHGWRWRVRIRGIVALCPVLGRGMPRRRRRGGAG
jgi:hypothetical protein